MNGFAKPQPAASGSRNARDIQSRLRTEKEIEAGGHALRLLARKGLWQLMTFTAVSALFFHFRHADLLAPLAENVRQLLGCPPPASLTSLALAGYTLSAAILIVNRAANGTGPVLKWAYVAYRLVFFLFYSFSNSLPDHFMEVFVAGLLLFGLEQMNIVTCSLKTRPPNGVLPGRS